MVVAIPVESGVLATRPFHANQRHARMAAAAVVLGGSTLAASAVSRLLHLAQRQPEFREHTRYIPSNMTSRGAQPCSLAQLTLPPPPRTSFLQA
jgi:hypothetical protein